MCLVDKLVPSCQVHAVTSFDHAARDRVLAESSPHVDVCFGKGEARNIRPECQMSVKLV